MKVLELKLVLKQLLIKQKYKRLKMVWYLRFFISCVIKKNTNLFINIFIYKKFHLLVIIQKYMLNIQKVLVLRKRFI